MIKVCSLEKRRAGAGECWSFPNAKLDRALAFARIGSQHGRVRRVSVCGRFARLYSDGIKVGGSAHVSALRKLVRNCPG